MQQAVYFGQSPLIEWHWLQDQAFELPRRHPNPLRPADSDSYPPQVAAIEDCKADFIAYCQWQAAQIIDHADGIKHRPFRSQGILPGVDESRFLINDGGVLALEPPLVDVPLHAPQFQRAGVQPQVSPIPDAVDVIEEVAGLDLEDNMQERVLFLLRDFHDGCAGGEQAESGGIDKRLTGVKRVVLAPKGSDANDKNR